MGTDDLVTRLRESYDGGAAGRDVLEKEAWKVAERAAFADLLKAEGAQRLLEIGAGTGQDSLFFMRQGLEVVATDLSAAMVDRCRAKGIDARASFNIEEFHTVEVGEGHLCQILILRA